VVRAPAYAVLLAVLALVAGCASDSSAEPADGPASASTSSSASDEADGPFQPTDDDRSEIRALLKKRSQAILDRDRTAFLATVDPAADDFVGTQQTLYDNLSKLPVESMRYTVDDASGLPPAKVEGEDPVFRPTVVEQVRLRDVDRSAVANPLEDTFVRRDGHWLLGAESLPGSYADSSEPQSRPWAGSVPIEVARSGDLLVVVDEEHSDAAGALAASVAGDIRFDADVLGIPPAYDVLVDATSVGEVTKMNTVDDREAAAVTMPVFSTNRDGQYTGLAGVRIKVNPEEATSVAEDSHVLRHELTHYLMLRPLLGAPTWLKEGLAEYVSTQPADFTEVPVDSQVAGHVLDVRRALPTTARWGLDPDADYLIARAAVSYLVDTYGMNRVLNLAKGYRRIPTDDPDQKTDQVLRRELDLSEADLVAATWDLLAQVD
jgi:hypothetical protein